MTQEEPKMIDHIITEEDLTLNPSLAEEGVEVGDVVQLPEVMTEEEVKEAGIDVEAIAKQLEEDTTANTIELPKRFYKNQEIISHGTRTVNDKVYVTVRVADGSSYDMSEDEYKNEVTIA